MPTKSKKPRNFVCDGEHVNINSEDEHFDGKKSPNASTMALEKRPFDGNKSKEKLKKGEESAYK